MSSAQHLVLNPSNPLPPTRDATNATVFSALPEAKEIKLHPTTAGFENASLYFVGNATVILEWEGVRLMTDPNFLHAGDHVHLGPGVTSRRMANPSVDLEALPHIDVVLLSHYHEDHFDKKVEDSLRRDLPIITTTHAKSHLTSKTGPGEAFTAVYELDTFASVVAYVKSEEEAPANTTAKVQALKVTAMPGKHVPPGILGSINDLIGAVPPTNGWMLELGSCIEGNDQTFQCGYRIYISGDTLMVDELKEIPQRYAGQNIDLMLVHLGGTTIPSPHTPILMVTMDASQGLELVRLIKPDVTIPIHFDDYDVMLSPLEDFKKEISQAGLDEKVIYLGRGDIYKFVVKQV
ncbi:beta-lactamase superfamily domain-containing protein [Rhexocercosporidium sp. MPI-PUGE-AT-0058]|nr:beta-lactamase superfamily domain-containing protein [Rhexocercosporidium sp. MPI-PUGE-AT-0058]